VVVVSVRWFASAVAPVLLGNMVGGTALFAHISYAQVMEEI
jgi:formate/nitrite transporter FocA (FNT family)